ncbi:HpcH/HpaI aldolase/citrate lyase family protein [Gordonia aichiensis]|uniref:ATP/GTP-binding protein n=1 Tax=Gordonia aichiensis NBRC 108223 TaxID=1220583 RepID=L7KRS5_9ACTN|nr:HpcH/HpaI aldolase/citrate lyase family protein [Gordonia aichiensis]GAC50413.1 hypothetical protein GOACH_24_00340 [Gordonia aichiensis NBRC 108223]
MTLTTTEVPSTRRAGNGARHFRHLSASTRERLFCVQPSPVSTTWSTPRLAIALGATLYVPATRADLAEVIMRRRADGVVSMVIDLEDAVDDADQATAIENAVDALRRFDSAESVEMMLFVRVRSADQIDTIAEAVGASNSLMGFVVPKFDADNAHDFLAAVHEAGKKSGRHFWAMPVLESAAVVHRETREHHLSVIADAVDEHRSRVLAVRIGATDMCGLFGIRRDRDLTIYDVRVAADVIASIINRLGRCDSSGHIITGPVWEYFADHERLFKPALRQTPFQDQGAVRFRSQLVSRDLDGLLREIALDRANGMHGKTVIHPSHAAAVHALSAVTHEEYNDALDILSSDAGGVQASAYRNKMNERKPHRNWASRVIDRAAVFGVTRPGVGFVDLLTAMDLS